MAKSLTQVELPPKPSEAWIDEAIDQVYFFTVDFDVPSLSLTTLSAHSLLRPVFRTGFGNGTLLFRALAVDLNLDRGAENICNASEHTERMPFVIRRLKPADLLLRGAHPLRQFCLRQSRVFSQRGHNCRATSQASPAFLKRSAKRGSLRRSSR